MTRRGRRSTPAVKQWCSSDCLQVRTKYGSSSQMRRTSRFQARRKWWSLRFPRRSSSTMPSQISPEEERILAAKIARAMSSGPRQITNDATVAEMGSDGSRIILRQGTNDWICFPGDENRVGDVPMCADPMGLQWMMDIKARKAKPTNTAPGFIYMLCGAMQHSNTDPFDRSSPPI